MPARRADRPTEEASVEAARLGMARVAGMLASRRNAAAVATAAGVDLSQQALRVLEALDSPSSPADIARRARMDPAAVSRQLRTLEADGLIIRKVPTAGGLVSVSATRAATTLVARVREVRNAHLTDALADWSSADRAALGRLLDRVVDDFARTPFRPVGSRRKP
jgi:DNA-binding MarR family transcriptional regulator